VPYGTRKIRKAICYELSKSNGNPSEAMNDLLEWGEQNK